MLSRDMVLGFDGARALGYDPIHALVLKTPTTKSGGTVSVLATQDGHRFNLRFAVYPKDSTTKILSIDRLTQILNGETVKTVHRKRVAI